MDVSRRELLKAGAQFGAAGLAYESLGGRMLASAQAATSGCGGQLSDIEHVVVLMQENRSFDGLFGTYPGVRGFDDHVNRQAFAQPGYRGPGSRNGHLLPYHLDGRKPVGQCLTDPTHDWAPQHLSWNHGRNDRFYEVHSQPQWDGAAGANVMGYFAKDDAPYFWALARAYTLCDMYFCSVIGPTEPNRVYSISASLDPAGRHGGPSLETVFNAQGLVGNFSWTTMPEQLQTRRITWKSYTAAGGQFDSPFPAFRQFRTNPKLNRLGIQPVYPRDFETDLSRDQLPSVSWIQVPFTQSEHAQFPVAAGEYAVDQVLRAIWRRPHIWRKTVVIINHDENGGFFDHVSPPTPPRGTKGEFLTVDPLPAAAGGIRGPIGLGFRVPCIVVSPWTRGGLGVLGHVRPHLRAAADRAALWRRGSQSQHVAALGHRRHDLSLQLRRSSRLLDSQLPATSATSPLVTTGQCAVPAPPPYPVPASIPVPRQQPGRARRPSGPCKSARRIAAPQGRG